MGFGSILGSVAQGALGLIGMGKQEDAYNNNMAFSREQLDYQKQLHQNQIQWRVSDAQKAGLHPLAALGLSSSSFSPVSTPSIPDYGSGYANLGDAAASLGQNIDSAIMAGKSKEEREGAQSLQQKAADISLQKGEAELEGIKLENDQKRWFLQQQMFPRPAISENSLIGGQPDAQGRYFDAPIVSDGFRLDSRGRKIDIIPSEDVKDRTEDVLGVEWMPFISSAVKNFKAKVLNREVDGYWWHGDDKGFLPYPPKRKKRNKDGKSVPSDSYYRNSSRYR